MRGGQPGHLDARNPTSRGRGRRVIQGATHRPSDQPLAGVRRVDATQTAIAAAQATNLASFCGVTPQKGFQCIDRLLPRVQPVPWGQLRKRVPALRVQLAVLLHQRERRVSAPGRHDPPTTPVVFSRSTSVDGGGISRAASIRTNDCRPGFPGRHSASGRRRRFRVALRFPIRSRSDVSVSCNMHSHRGDRLPKFQHGRGVRRAVHPRPEGTIVRRSRPTRTAHPGTGVGRAGIRLRHNRTGRQQRPVGRLDEDHRRADAERLRRKRAQAMDHEQPSG